MNAFSTTSLFVVALFVGGLAAALAGLIVGIPTLRLRGDYLAIATLGFGEIIRVILQNTEKIGGSRGFSVGGTYTTFFWTYALAAMTIYVVANFVHSAYGRGFLTVRDDEIAAEAIGINTVKYKVVAFVLAAFFAGLAGGLYAHFVGYLTPEGFQFPELDRSHRHGDRGRDGQHGRRHFRRGFAHPFARVAARRAAIPDGNLLPAPHHAHADSPARTLRWIKFAFALVAQKDLSS